MEHILGSSSNVCTDIDMQCAEGNQLVTITGDTDPK